MRDNLRRCGFEALAVEFASFVAGSGGQSALPLLHKFPYRRVVQLRGPRTGGMAKSISEVMDDLRQDVARWKAEPTHLRAQGVTPHIEKVEKFIADAEAILSRWESPN